MVVKKKAWPCMQGDALSPSSPLAAAAGRDIACGRQRRTWKLRWSLFGSITLLRGTGVPLIRCRPRPYRHSLRTARKWVRKE